MAADRPPSRPPRARAVGELPRELLLERAEELTRRWALALVRARPIEGLGSLGLAGMAGDGRDLCRALLGALCAEEELARVTGEHAGEPSVAAGLATLAGARDARGLVEAVEALRGAAWELLTEEIYGPLALSPRAVADTGDRLAYVCSCLLGDALAAASLGEQPARQAGALASGFPVRPVRAEQPAPRLAPSGRAVIFDERADSPPELDREHDAGGAGAVPPGSGAGPGEEGPQGPRLATMPVVLREGANPSRAPEIEIRDERREEGPVAWIGSIGRQLERFGSDGRPFAVLLAEPLEIERSRAERVPKGTAATLSRFERLLADELARTAGGWLTRERPGRYWLIAPETDRIAAVALRERLELTVASGAGGLGARMAIAVGIAVCPEDGERAPALAAHADIGLYAARAEARAAASRLAGDGGGER